MPARIVVVHDDVEFVEAVALALRADGLDVATFADPIAAWDGLEAAQRTEVLVTRVTFPPGRSNGMAVARMARSKRPQIRVLFISSPPNVREIEDEGTFIVWPAPTDAVAAAVKKLLNEPPIAQRKAVRD